MKAKTVVMVQRALLEPVLCQSELTRLQVVQEAVVEAAAPVHEEQGGGSGARKEGICLGGNNSYVPGLQEG